MGLIGVLVGWVLGLLTELIRERRDAKIAGRLILAELRWNEAFLRRVVELSGDVPLDAPPHRSVWEGMGAAFLRLGNRNLADEVAAAYQSTDTVWMTIRYTKMARDAAEVRMEERTAYLQSKPPDQVTEIEQRLHAQTITSVEGLHEQLSQYSEQVRERELPFTRELIRKVDATIT